MAAFEWDQVRVFLAVMRARSLGGAAERLGMDVSTVSRRLDRLEADLSAVLFERTRDGTLPTASAEHLLAHAEEIELGVMRFSAARAQVETEVEGVVRLTVPPGVADVFVVPALAELHRAHPRLVIELDASVRYADLTRHEADLALRVVRPTSGELTVTRLVNTPELPMTSPAYARELGKLERLSDARWVSWGNDLGHLPAARWLREREVEPVLRTSHFPSQLAAAQAGFGVVILPQPYESTGLVPVAHARKLSESWASLPHAELWLVGHRALRNVPRVAAVWDLLVAKLTPEGARAAGTRGASRPAPKTRR